MSAAEADDCSANLSKQCRMTLSQKRTAGLSRNSIFGVPAVKRATTYAGREHHNETKRW